MHKLLLILVAVVLLLAACSGRNREVRPTPTRIAIQATAIPSRSPAETPIPVEPLTSAEETPALETTAEPTAVVMNIVETPQDKDRRSEDAEAGFALFQSVGCAACHGPEGNGAIGPALAGHSREQVFRQVRTPKGDIMPAFPPERLSDEDVEQIVAWIESLGSEMVMEHNEGKAFDLTMTEADHLRLILDAIAAENEPNAIHHAQHLVDDSAPDILPMAQTLLADLQAGKDHDVEMAAGEILGPLANEDFDRINVHLGMTLTALQRDDLPDADHHMASAAEAAAGHDHETDMHRLQQELSARNDLHAVTDQLFTLLKLEHPLHTAP